MASPKVAKDIRDYLVAQAVLTPCSVGALEDSPIDQGAVVEYFGPPNIKVHGTGVGIALDEANVQVQVRNRNNQTALNNIQAVVDALDGLSGTTINSTYYTWVSLLSRPRILDHQDDGSLIYIAEFRIQARR